MILFSEIGKIREKHVRTFGFGYVNLACLLAFGSHQYVDMCLLIYLN